MITKHDLLEIEKHIYLIKTVVIDLEFLIEKIKNNLYEAEKEAIRCEVKDGF